MPTDEPTKPRKRRMVMWLALAIALILAVIGLSIVKSPPFDFIKEHHGKAVSYPWIDQKREIGRVAFTVPSVYTESYYAFEGDPETVKNAIATEVRKSPGYRVGAAGDNVTYELPDPDAYVRFYPYAPERTAPGTTCLAAVGKRRTWLGEKLDYLKSLIGM